MSTVYHCDHCESQCSADCEQTPKYGSTVLWCMRSVPANSSKEESMNNGDGDGFTFDNSVSVKWIEPSPTLANPPYLSSPVNHQLCLCSLSTGATQCNSSSDEGVYKCIIKGSDVIETLQFTYSVYKLTTVPSTSAPGNNVIITSSRRTIKASTTLPTIIATTAKTTTNIPSIDTPCSLDLLHVTACPSSNQNSTLPYYSGIGLLLTTNLVTFIVLVTGCVYIIYSKKQTKYALGRSRANVTVQSNPIRSSSVINIETEIQNEEYNTCPQEQQEQQESPHPIGVYSYVVIDKEDHSTADNDEYAVPDDLCEVKGKGSNPPPSVPPPYAGKGVDKVEETVNGVGNSSSVDNLDCSYATIGSKEEEKEQVNKD
ncbi:PREDICTED: uncharacterized protein LOC109584476 [Amphimedon queenslandica]|uniref:Uncharacterized protein n=1 Tax=Amphimedon queenslandica TaxID=400682 RepID=A0AAN0JFH1_AMPQE|nr:PREDICTED: uncharacterized protein LOC109584476 [Amphimedon queenslandica]|eukprot:XP_019855785.1 PREDICTED: uncharacterized protein LOC109584476 [Amphimedon queenslandica]